MGQDNLVSILSKLARFYTHSFDIGRAFVRSDVRPVLADDRGMGRWPLFFIAVVVLGIGFVFYQGLEWSVGEARAQNRRQRVQRVVLQAQRFDAQRITAIWRRLEQEPGILAVQAAAARRVPALRSRLTGVQRGWLALVPTRVRFRVHQRDDNDYSDTRYDGDEWRQRFKRGSRIGWQIETEWDIGRWLNDSQWLAVDKERETRRQRRDAAIDLATRLYFERRQLQLRYLIRARYIAQDGVRVWVRIHRITAQLDALTGGLFRLSPVVWWQEVARNKGHP